MSWSEKKLYYKVVLPFSKVLEEMEYFGMKINTQRLEELSFEFTERMNKLQSQIWRHTGEININSSQQLAGALYEKLKLPNYVDDYMIEKGRWVKYQDQFLTDKLKPSVNIICLKKLQSTTEHPVMEPLIEYKKLSSLVSKYVGKDENSGLRKHVHNGRVHGNYFQLTVGGRINISEPNLANIPSRDPDGRKIKEAFLADEGQVLVHFDYAAMELRGMAWLANDRVMLPAFKSNKDVHSLTGETIFGIPYDELIAGKNGIHKDKRFCAKTTNFLIIYGGSYQALQAQLLKYGNLYFNGKDCDKFIRSFFITYPNVEPLQKAIETRILSQGYLDNLFGRRRYFGTIDPSRKTLVSAAMREGMSHYIQGSTSGDYSAYKCVLLHKIIKDKGWKARFYNTLYDGFYFSVDEDQAEEFYNFLGPFLEEPVDPIEIPLPVEGKIGKRWADV